MRPSVSRYHFESTVFADLRARFIAGTLSAAASRLSRPPTPLSQLDPDPICPKPTPSSLEAARGALERGELAILVLNGGMATRFGGVPKGIVSVVHGEPESFLTLKLAQTQHIAGAPDARIPFVLMNSFATRDATFAHLEAIEWGGVPETLRFSFDQSLLPRITPEGDLIAELPDGDRIHDTRVYSAPGHGDTLRMLRLSGTWERLMAAGVRHLLVSNVDNLGASVDPELFAQHLEATTRGSQLSVEVVERRTNDAGGCVAAVDGRPQIVEGFRLPEGTDMASYPHFNTNTLWFHLPALEHELPLTWFPVRRSISMPDGREQPIVQFEQLIGQATEFLPTSVLAVDRGERFNPIKTRDDLAAAEASMRREIERTRATAASD